MLLCKMTSMEERFNNTSFFKQMEAIEQNWMIPIHLLFLKTLITYTLTFETLTVLPAPF